MKRVKLIIFSVFLLLINITCVSAKNILYRCNYSLYDSQDTSKTYTVSALCDIYTNLSHQCYIESSKTEATATTKSNKESILNWKKEKVGLGWTAKNYVETNKTCPDYLNVEIKIGVGLFSNETIRNYRIFASPTLQDAQNVEAYLKEENKNKNAFKYEYYVLNKTNDNKNQMIDSVSTETTCEVLFKGDLGEFLGEIFSFIRYTVPVLILGLGVIDFIKGIAAQNQDEIKKAAIRFAQRIAIGIIIFLLPTLIDLILGIAGFGLNDGKCFDWLR